MSLAVGGFLGTGIPTSVHARRSARAALEQMSAHYDARLFEARARNRHVAQKVQDLSERMGHLEVRRRGRCYPRVEIIGYLPQMFHKDFPPLTYTEKSQSEPPTQ